jgi:hypothetical protein
LLLVAVEVVVVVGDDGGGDGGGGDDGGCCCCVVVRCVWLPFWVCLGDAACHVIYVGTCCPNLSN